MVFTKEEIDKAHNHPLWYEIRGFVETLRPQILAQMRAQITRKNKTDYTRHLDDEATSAMSVEKGPIQGS